MKSSTIAQEIRPLQDQERTVPESSRSVHFAWHVLVVCTSSEFSI